MKIDNCYRHQHALQLDVVIRTVNSLFITYGCGDSLLDKFGEGIWAVLEDQIEDYFREKMDKPSFVIERLETSIRPARQQAQLHKAEMVLPGLTNNTLFKSISRVESKLRSRASAKTRRIARPKKQK